MEKYNLSEIMKRAWEIVRKTGASFAAALKFSWACAKKALEIKAKECRDGGNYKVTFSVWDKYGKIRAYYRCNWWSKYANAKSYNFVEM